MNGGVTERQTDRQTERRTDGRKEGRTDGRKEGRTDGQNVLRRCERLGLSLCAVPSLNGTVCVFLFGRVGITGRAKERVTEVEDGRSAERRNKYGKME